MYLMLGATPVLSSTDNSRVANISNSRRFCLLDRKKSGIRSAFMSFLSLGCAVTCIVFAEFEKKEENSILLSVGFFGCMAVSIGFFVDASHKLFPGLYPTSEDPNQLTEDLRVAEIDCDWFSSSPLVEGTPPPTYEECTRGGWLTSYSLGNCDNGAAKIGESELGAPSARLVGVSSQQPLKGSRSKCSTL